MSLLSQVTKGKIEKPLFVTIYGPPGVGKSTFAASAPNPIFIGTEEGTYNLDVARFPKIDSFEKLKLAIDALMNEEHKYQTVVLDTLDALEPMIWNFVCAIDKAKTIESAQGGYGKGFVLANKYWSNVIANLHVLRDQKNMHVVAIAHSQVKTFNDPTLLQSYDRYQLKLNEKAAALWRESCDVLGFANFDTVLKSGDTEKKNRAFSDGKRILYTERRPAFDAKNRIGLPFEVPLSFPEMLKGSCASSDDIKKRVLEKVANMSDPELQKKVEQAVIAAGDNRENLISIDNRLNELTKQ